MRGLSLIEMAIAISIIGLLAGGILTGKSLLRAAEIRSIAEQEQRIVTAVNAFKDRYDSLPGDMFNATDYWGALHPDPATCKETAATGRETCNGDGDDRIEIQDFTLSYEHFRMWQHLANAGMYDGKYTGTGAPGLYGCDFHPGGNAPPAKITGAGYIVHYFGTQNDGGFLFGGEYGHSILLGQMYSNPWNGMGTGMPDGAFLTAEEMRNFDQKYDDGKPVSGAIRPYDATVRPDCTDSDLPTAEYKTDKETLACNIVFANAF